MMTAAKTTNLIIILLLLIIHNIEEPQLIHALTRAHHTQPIPQLLLLQELFGEVLEVAAGELDVAHDLDLVAADLADLDAVAEVACAALDLDALVQELLEGADVKNFIGDGLGTVDRVLW